MTLTNPGLFLAGAAAVIVPLLIHLLSRRRYRVVPWAAMEFLREADQKNRRRIRLEDLLLLALRCLAVLLVGLLLARPILPSGLTAGLIDAAAVEQIVLLDDSLSMQARVGNDSAFDLARQRLQGLAGSLAQQPGEHSLTLLLTSQPGQRVLNDVPLGAGTVDEARAVLEKLQAGDGSANLAAVLEELEHYLVSRPANVNRVVYVLTDLRQHDWKTGEDDRAAPLSAFARLAKLVQGCYLIDAADDDDGNLSITAIRPEGPLVLNVPAAVDVAVTNHGSAAAGPVHVKLTVSGGLPLASTIDRLGPGETSPVRFGVTLADESHDGDATPPQPRAIQAALESGAPGSGDRLPADDTANFAAQPVRGIPVLLIDGDASAEFGRGESFYLRRALAPRGPVSSGIAVQVAAEDELDTLEWRDLQVVFLLDAGRLGKQTAEIVQRLESWVASGGGLVIMPGDQMDEDSFDNHFWRDGAGLSPLRLGNIAGDESGATWVALRIEDASHKMLRPFAGQNNPLLDNVRIFRWWSSNVPSGRKPPAPTAVSVLARLTDADRSPAIAEKSLGQGRVVAFAVPADADWHNWPSHPSYLLLVQDLVRYLAADRAARFQLTVGEPIRQPVDLTRYALDAVLRGPRGLQASLQAAAPAPAEAEPREQAVWHVAYPAAPWLGLYELALRRREGGSETLLFAANADPAESDLRRVDRHWLERELTGANVRVLALAQWLSLAAGTQTEIGWHLVWVLAAVLFAEQLLGWRFGRRRT